MNELTRAVYGHNNTPGMLSDQKILAEKMDDIKKLVWIVLTLTTGLFLEGIYLAVSRGLFAP